MSGMVGLLIFKLGTIIYEWRKSEIKSHLILTPIHFIFTDLNTIKYTFLWNLKDIKFTNHYVNGVYSRTVMNLIFLDENKTVNFQSIITAQQFHNKVNELLYIASQAEKNNNTNYFLNEDDLYGEDIPGTVQLTKDKTNKKLGYLISVVLVGLFTFGMSVRNDSIRSDDHAHIPPHKYTNEYSNPESGSQNSINNENSGVENKSADGKIKLVEKPLPRNGSTIYYSTESRVLHSKLKLPPNFDTSLSLKIIIRLKKS